MKNLKKLLVLTLVIAAVMAIGVTAFAAEGDVTVTLPDTNYKYYQIFTGDVSGDELTNIKWGTDGNGTTGAGVDAATLAAIVGITGTNAEKAVAIRAYVTGAGTAATDTSLSLAPGYYLFEDTAAGTGTDVFVSLDVVKVCKDLEVETKGDVPEVEKKVKDINDTTGTETGWQDSADYDIGDDVPFQLTATMPNSFDGYDTYMVVFHDTLSGGLTFNNDVTVTIGSTTYEADDFAENGISVDTTNGLKITIDDVLDLGVSASSKIVVDYTAELNTTANIGGTGNPNTVYLEYSNNPNWEGDGTPTGTTPKDKVIVFTYQVIANKTDESGAPLTGAGFTLYKKDAQGNYVAVGSEVKGEAMTQFTWSGLDDGDYELVETTTPNNYNTMDPQFFTITAAHDDETLTLTSLTGTADEDEGSVITFTPALAAGSLTSIIVNQSGAELPETGGMGTQIFYVLGGILLVGAAVLLITKKRMSAEN